MTTTDESSRPATAREAAAELGFGNRPLRSAERELEEVLAAARSLGIDDEPVEDDEYDATAAQAVAELGLDQPVVQEETPVAAFLTEDEEYEEYDEEDHIRIEHVQQPDAAWFAVNTYTGHENRVRDALDLRIRNMDVEHQFVALEGETGKNGERRYVLVPTQQEVEIRGGKRREVERKLLPGYVLVQIRLDPRTGDLHDNSWHVVSGTQGVNGFVGTRDEQREHARPLPPEEVAAIIGQTRVEEPRVRVGFAVNDPVRVTDGPFLDFVAQVEEINIEKGKVKVLISMFGRETPLELDFDQVEKQ